MILYLYIKMYTVLEPIIRFAKLLIQFVERGGGGSTGPPDPPYFVPAHKANYKKEKSEKNSKINNFNLEGLYLAEKMTGILF